ncbi:MAG: heme exporter protein CcmB [Deltaproteobacteria bacterium]|nr:heme exporter protein CcmB [Deltaproteobacteria bacterium]
MSHTTSSWLAEAFAVFAKEWRTEFRTRYALNTLGLFAITSLVVVSISLGPLGAATAERTTVMPVLLWVLLLFAVAAGLPRAFVHEEESRTATALRLSATPSALFTGKLLYSWTVVLALELIVTPLFVAMMHLPVANPGLLALALVLGGYGLAAGGTLVAAIIAQARSSGTLFSVLALPVLLPLLVLAIELSRAAIAGDFVPVVPRQLLLYDASVTVAGLLLFPAVWNP